MRLRKIISGGQTGVDEAGLVVGKRFGLETGGYIPAGFKTLRGPRPEYAQLYGMMESFSDNYMPRTYQNAKHSDGTVRLAGNFKSRGELCTLAAIKKYNKPHFDVDLTDPPEASEFVVWLETNNIETLNVAGNAEETFKGAFRLSEKFLTESLFLAGFAITLRVEDILRMMNLDANNITAYTSDQKVLEYLSVRKPV